MLVENKMGLPIARSTRRGGVTIICDVKELLLQVQ